MGDGWPIPAEGRSEPLVSITPTITAVSMSCRRSVDSKKGVCALTRSISVAQIDSLRSNLIPVADTRAAGVDQSHDPMPLRVIVDNDVILADQRFLLIEIPTPLSPPKITCPSGGMGGSNDAVFIESYEPSPDTAPGKQRKWAHRSILQADSMLSRIDQAIGPPPARSFSYPHPLPTDVKVSIDRHSNSTGTTVE